MLLALFALALFAGFRGWFPWSIALFGVVYAFTIIDYGSISYSTNLAQFGVNTTAGSLLQLVSGAVLAWMSVFQRA